MRNASWLVVMFLVLAVPLVALATSSARTAAAKAAAKPAARPAGKPAARPAETVADGANEVVGHVEKTPAEWQHVLTPSQFHVLREKGTEIAFTGAYWNEHRSGSYRCAACGLTLFDSRTKFESGTGWPSFWAPIAKSHVMTDSDTSLGVERDEVVCARCGGHLGHVFDDGPRPTGLRYCMNSAALKFVAAK